MSGNVAMVRNYASGSMCPESEKIVIIRPRSRSHSGSSIDASSKQQNLTVPKIEIEGESIEHMPPVDEKMRDRLRYYFMTTCEKFRAKRSWPLKLVLQLLKLGLVTLQLYLFGQMRSSRVMFLDDNLLAFHHLYMKNWELTYEAAPYPPSHGTFAIYTLPDFYDSINYALERYLKTDDLALGSYRLRLQNDTFPQVNLCIKEYQTGNIWTPNNAYNLDTAKVLECFRIKPMNLSLNNNTNTWDYDTEKYLKEKYNKTITFDSLVIAELKLSLKSVHLKDSITLQEPECIEFNISITYDNTRHSGKVPVRLTQRTGSFECKGRVIHQEEHYIWDGLISVFDGVVILVSTLSIIVCIRSLIKAQFLMMDAANFFWIRFGIKLSIYDRLEFLNLWYVLMVINDVLTISGSICKIIIISEKSDNNRYEACGILLGTGSLFVWFGVLRYLSFFNKYNILILTVKRALPSILRFLVCVGVITFGFMFCGWVVLGPYHIKFRQLHTSLECLFSLMNGDELFVTFATIDDDIPQVGMWWYSRIYLYFFLCLYIYCILSLVVSIIMESYDTIKFYCQHGFPQSEMWKFIDKEGGDNKESDREDSSSDSDRGCCPTSTCCNTSPSDVTPPRKTGPDPTESTPLLRKKMSIPMA